MEIPFYPVNDFGPAMKGLIIGGLGIFHVFLAQFAIGGGMLMCYFQWLDQQHLPTENEHSGPTLFRRFIDGYFKLLVLISFVTGAVTGVGMWFTSIQISPRTIGVMVDEFHWLWAIEWTFFCLEVVAGYCFYRYGPLLNHRARFTLLVLYSAAAWFSLFWINGILSWQLTPGEWLHNHSVWAGFFNASFWPSLFFRTITSMTVAALVACIIVNAVPDLSRDERQQLISRAAHFLAPMVLMPLLGVWFFAVIPEDSRTWVMGGSVAMSMFLALGIGASALIGGYAVLGLLKQKLFINGATATLLTVLAFVASAGGEFVREGVRKPFTIRETLYSNSITPDEISVLREVGCATLDPYPLQNPEQYVTDQLKLGAHVYRVQCSVCHTMDGANALSHLTAHWAVSQKRMNIAMLQRTKDFMPPFAGTAEEVEALVQLLTWHNRGRPAEWPVPNSSESAPVIAQIQGWLDEAGTGPGSDAVTLQKNVPDRSDAVAANHNAGVHQDSVGKGRP